ncbi:hypothetical protein GCM10020219_082850 [Nonomuraea dietziae]
MIDFRYHLVSIVAIFLALAVGIVMGTTLLSNPAIESALQTADDLRKSNSDYRDQLAALQAREAGNDDFVTAEIPALVRAQLTGESVLLVAAPGSSGTLREQSVQVLTEAGATISGQVTIAEKYLDPTQANFIDQLTTQLKPAGLTLPRHRPVQERRHGAGRRARHRRRHAGRHGEHHHGGRSRRLREGGPCSASTAPPPSGPRSRWSSLPTRRSWGRRRRHRPVRSSRWQEGSTTVPRAPRSRASWPRPSPAASSPRCATRATLAAKVSTVDTLDMPAGRVVVVYSLREQLDGRAGQYGIGPDASEFQPASSAATPSPTTSGS